MKVQDINTKEIFEVTKKGDEVLLAGDSGRTLQVTNTLFQREFGRGGCLVEMKNEQVENNWILVGRNTICPKHNSVMTFGRYSRKPAFSKAHKIVNGKYYYCDTCVNEITAR